MGKIRIFVFGSNLAGRHGKGAALHARQFYGAIYGQGEGLQGESYAIPTKDKHLYPLSLSRIKQHIDTFVNFAKGNQHMTFDVTPVGCGLAGYNQEQIKPLFKNAPANVHFTKEWII